MDEFLQTDYHWKTFMELQCNFQMKYIGTPMLHYCPMTKLEKKPEELQIIFDGVSNFLKN